MSKFLYTKAIVKSDFIAGKLLGYTLIRSSIHTGWYVSFLVKGNPQSVYMTDYNGDIKVIMSLDAVVSLLESIGFRVRLLTHY